MTWAPAPTAKRSSVPEGESETTRVGRVLTTTSPLAAWIVTGNAAAVGLATEAGARMAARATTRTRERRSTNPPFREGFGCAAGDRSSDSGLPPPPPSQARGPSGVWWGSVSPYSGGTVPVFHRSSLTARRFGARL